MGGLRNATRQILELLEEPLDGSHRIANSTDTDLGWQSPFTPFSADPYLSKDNQLRENPEPKSELTCQDQKARWVSPETCIVDGGLSVSERNGIVPLSQITVNNQF